MTEKELYDLYIADVMHEEMMIEKEEKKMGRQIIFLKDITLEEAEKLENYVWKQDKLIPAEMIEGE